MTIQKLTDIITAVVIILLIIWASLNLITPRPMPTTTATPAIITPTPTEPPPPALPTQYSNLGLTWKDIKLLAQMEYAEARGEPEDGRIAVIKVALNRLKHKAFPKSIPEIIYAPGQFSTAPILKYIEPEDSDYAAVYKALADEGPILDPDIVYFSQKGENNRIAFKIGNHVFCRV